MSDDPRPLDFDAFRELATREGISEHERIGFADEYREGKEGAILADLTTKLPVLRGRGGVLIDIGCGAGPLARLIRDRCIERGIELVLVDSAEMLAHHADAPGLEKIAARFPDAPVLAERYRGRASGVLAYSVLQYPFNEGGVFAFVDAAGELLAPGGRLLLGDIPNASMRRRFLASDSGRVFHRAFSGRDEDPMVEWNTLPRGEIDDAVVLGLLARARAGGFHAWVLPQSPDLPMANRREDILIAQP
jgi:hypothetical protein